MEKFKTSKSSSYWAKHSSGLFLVSSGCGPWQMRQWEPKKWQMCPARPGQKRGRIQRKAQTMPGIMVNEYRGLRNCLYRNVTLRPSQGQVPRICMGTLVQLFSFRGERPDLDSNGRSVLEGQWNGHPSLYCIVILWRRLLTEHLWEGPQEGLQTWVNEDHSLWGGGVNLSKWGSRGSLFFFFSSTVLLLKLLLAFCEIKCTLRGWVSCCIVPIVPLSTSSHQRLPVRSYIPQ